MARAGPSGERENYDQIIWHNLMGVPGQACAQFPPIYIIIEKFQNFNQSKTIYLPTLEKSFIIPVEPTYLPTLNPTYLPTYLVITARLPVLGMEFVPTAGHFTT
jgi:hypothetical protein